MAPMTVHPRRSEPDVELSKLTPAQTAALHQAYQLILARIPSLTAVQSGKENTPPPLTTPPLAPPPTRRARRRAGGAS